jgi:P27 family predicted phage terminase small subunit
MLGRKPEALTILKGARPGGGRTKHIHPMKPLLQAPEHLDAEEKAVFEAVRTNAPAGMLAEVDRFLLEVFSRHVVLHRRCVRELDALIFDTETTKRAHPLLAAAAGQAKILLSLAESLGLTAAARQRIKLPEVDLGSWADIGA